MVGLSAPANGRVARAAEAVLDKLFLIGIQLVFIPYYFNQLNIFGAGQTLMMSSGSAQPRRAWETP